MPFHSGLVALVGRPNAGKSSLLNALVGERIAAVSSKPQTTRNRVVGIWNPEEAQIVLLDTPGVHEAWTPMNVRMVEAAFSVVEEVDAVAWIVDVVPLMTAVHENRPILDESHLQLGERLNKGRQPLVVVLNKIDLVQRHDLLPIIAAFSAITANVVPVSAKKRDGLDALARTLARVLPEQPALYPDDILTDATERFIVAELIRERIFEHCAQEVPYASAVEIEKFDESAREAGLVHIHARIVVEKESQKGILIGRGGKMIKRIGTESRRQIEALLGCRVRLDLFVAVERDWTQNPRLLKELGVG